MNSQRYRPLSWALVLAWATACTAPAIPEQGAGSAAGDGAVSGNGSGVVGRAGDAAAIFAGLEDRLLGASAISCRYTISAAGAFSASLEGALEMSGGSTTDLSATGMFGGDSVALHLRSDGGRMAGGNADRLFEEPTPAGLREALLLGLTRMGLLHNLARLTGAAAPDRAAGGVRDWVEVRDVRFASVAEGAGPESELIALQFAIYVSGERTAEATLRLDPESGLPVRREQVVSFPGGEMTVTESYDFAELP